VERKIFEGRNIFKCGDSIIQSIHFLIMRDYAKITTKEDRKQVKLAGDSLENAMQYLME